MKLLMTNGADARSTDKNGNNILHQLSGNKLCDDTLQFIQAKGPD